MTVTAGADVLTASADDSTAWRPSELAIVVAYLSGELRQRRTGIGWAAVRDLPHPTPFAVLTVAEVDAAFERIANVAGAGSQATRATELRNLFAAATPAEQRFLQALATGELRQGALDGVMVDAIAKAADVPLALVRQAFMLRGSLPPVAVAALTGGTDALNAIGLELGRPLRPMLAQSVPSVAEALAKVGGTVALEWKLDGIRVQIHRQTKENRQAGESGVEVQVFTRTLDDITARLPEAVEAIGALPVRSAVFDGELIALRDDGRPHPFQVTSARVARRGPGQEVPLSVFLFDVLHADGTDLIDRPGAELLRERRARPRRHQALRRGADRVVRGPAVTTLLAVALLCWMSFAAGAWHAEWQPFAHLLGLGGSAASWSAELLGGLRVDTARMAANLNASGGLPLAERVTGLLAGALGGPRAHDLVAGAAARSVASGIPLRDVILSAPELEESGAKITAAPIALRTAFMRGSPAPAAAKSPDSRGHRGCRDAPLRRASRSRG